LNCIFCKIVSGEIPSTKVYEDEDMLAFRDLSPQAPEHVLLVPKKHIQSISHAGQEDLSLLGKMQLKLAEIARNLGLEEAGYRVVTNIGSDGGQTVDHLHYHLLGGRSLQWPPG